MWTGKATPINISFRNLGLLCWIKFRLSKDDLGLTWFLPVPLPMGQFALYCYDYHILYSLSVFGSSALQFQDHTSVILWQVQQRLVKNRWFSLRSVPAPHEHVQPFPSHVANICIEMHICAWAVTRSISQSDLGRQISMLTLSESQSWADISLRKADRWHSKMTTMRRWQVNLSLRILKLWLICAL